MSMAYGIPALHLTNEAALTMISVFGQSTGIVKSGHSGTWVIPFNQGNPLSQNLINLHLGGHDLTNHLIAEQKWLLS
jgi:actin-related protein